jgi:hypothetical protein
MSAVEVIFAAARKQTLLATTLDIALRQHLTLLFR